MSEIVLNAAKMMDILPEDEQELAFELIKRLVVAWDPDYTKLTQSEKENLHAAEASGFVNEGDIDWNNLEKFA